MVVIKCFAPLSAGYVQTRFSSVIRADVWLTTFCALVFVIASVIRTTSPQ